MPDNTIYPDPREHERVDQTFGDPEPPPGILLKKGIPESQVAEAALKLWESKNSFFNRAEAEWEVNELRRMGIKSVQLREETDDMSTWYAWTPPGQQLTPDVTYAMNKAATLCRKLTALMFTDPPGPDAQPDSGEDEDADAAEFSTRFLKSIQRPTETNSLKMLRRAYDRSHTFGSGFIRVMVDPNAKRIPMQISAGTGAEHVDDAIVDPETGLEWMDFVERFVRPDGSLTNKVSEAAVRNAPGLKEEVLTGRNVRMIPHTAESIEDAIGVQIASFVTWGALKRLVPDLAKLDKNPEERKKIFEYRPSNHSAIVSAEQRKNLDSSDLKGNEDERLVFVLTTYYRQHPGVYPEGAYVVTVGKHFAPIREKWDVKDEEGRTISLPLPLAQVKGWEEGSPNPYGHGTMHIVGTGNELRGQVIAAYIDHIDRLINRKIFVPTTSVLQPQDFFLPAKTPIPINPGGQPFYEDIPSFSQDGLNLINLTTDEMENDVSVGQVAQGLESAQVQSGRHAQAIVSQVHASLTEPRQNIIEAYERLCHIELMMARAFFSVPQRIGFVGEDGAYKERRWTGADLRNTSDVRLQPGTLTLMSPIQKAAFADQLFQLGVMDQHEYIENVASNLGGLLALQDDPFRMRIRRQIAAWAQGPPEGWRPAFEQQPVPDPVTGQPLLDQNGMPIMQDVQVLDQTLAGIFRPYPADDDPFVALTRRRELAKAMSGSRFAAAAPEWQFGITQDYNRSVGMSGAAGGLLPGQLPASPSPAQQTQGPLAPPEVPLPSDTDQAQVT